MNNYELSDISEKIFKDQDKQGKISQRKKDKLRNGKELLSILIIILKYIRCHMYIARIGSMKKEQ